MIIWINGDFGSGKTQTAFELNRRIPNSFVYDPEETMEEQVKLSKNFSKIKYLYNFVLEGRLVEKKKLTMIIILILLGLLFIVWYTQPKTPLAALENGYTSKKESVLRYSSLIKQIDIDSQTSLLFYYNGNGNVNCAVAEKKISRYKIINVSAELSENKEVLRVGLHGSVYDKGTKWIYFGIIYDDSVEKVVWNDIEATRFSLLNLDMVYAIGDGEFEGDEYYIYDSNGNKLDHHRLVQ